MRTFLLAVLLTGFSVQAMGCAGTQGGASTSSQDAGTYYDRGVELYGKGDLAGAIAEYRTALRLDPNFVAAHFNLGHALLKNGDVEGAIAEYRTALRLAPNFPAAHYNLGIELQQLGRKAEAREEFTAVQRLVPNTPANQQKIEQVRQRLRELE